MTDTVTLRAQTGRTPVLVMIGSVVFMAVVLAFCLIAETFSIAPFFLLAAFNFAQGVQMRRARVELRDEGLTIRPPRLGRTRFLPWGDVSDLRVDPPGGPRVVRLRLDAGREVELPPLTESDRSTLLSMYEAKTS